ASTDAGVDASADAGVDAADCIFDFAEGGPFLEARPYRSAADSPFTGCSFPSYFYLANFEGDSGLPPGTTANGGSKYPGAGLVSGIVDSVDGDDGFPD